MYTNNDCLVTYGSYIEYPANERGKFSKQVPDFVVEKKIFRKCIWMTSHLRTFKYKLWKNVRRQRCIGFYWKNICHGRRFTRDVSNARDGRREKFLYRRYFICL